MRTKFDPNHIRSICKKDVSPDTFPSMDAQTAVNELCRYFLGKDWCDYSGVTHPEQVNVNIVCAIEKQCKGAKLKCKVIYE